MHSAGFPPKGFAINFAACVVNPPFLSRWRLARRLSRRCSPPPPLPFCLLILFSPTRNPAHLAAHLAPSFFEALGFSHKKVPPNFLLAIFQPLIGARPAQIAFHTNHTSSTGCYPRSYREKKPIPYHRSVRLLCGGSSVSIVGAAPFQFCSGLLLFVLSRRLDPPREITAGAMTNSPPTMAAITAGSPENLERTPRTSSTTESSAHFTSCPCAVRSLL